MKNIRTQDTCTSCKHVVVETNYDCPNRYFCNLARAYKPDPYEDEDRPCPSDEKAFEEWRDKVEKPTEELRSSISVCEETVCDLYEKRESAKRREALDQLAAHDQELGME